MTAYAQSADVSWVKDGTHRFVSASPGLERRLSGKGIVVGRRDDDFFPAALVARYRAGDSLAAERDRPILVYEPGGVLPRGITVKRPVVIGGGARAILGVFHEWSTGGIRDSLGIGSDPSSTMPAWLSRTRERLRSQFRGPLLVRDLASEGCVHPDTLGRRFRQVFGMTVPEAVRKERVAWTLMEISRGGDLSAIAYAAGFADQSHFTRDFHREVGMPPGRFRSLFE